MQKKTTVLMLAGLLLSTQANANELDQLLIETCGFDVGFPQDEQIYSEFAALREVDGNIIPPDFCSDINGGDTQAFSLMLGAMTPNQLGSVARTSYEAGRSQGKAISHRLQNLRDMGPGAGNSDVSAIQLKQVAGGAASAEALLGQGIAVFGSIQMNNGDKDKTSLEESYDWSGTSLSVGGDYRLSHNLIVGGALGLSNNNTSFGSSRGSMDSTSLALSTYGTFYTDKSYFDWMAGYGYFDYKTRRDVVFMTVNTSASGDTNGNQWTFNVSGGTDFFIGDKTLSPYLGVSYVDTGIKSYTETGAGSYNYDINKQNSTSTLSTLGLRVSQAKSYCWGIFSPSAYAEWQYEFNRNSRSISSAFEVDPTVVFNVDTDLPDRSYFNTGVAVSAMLPGGRAGFVSISRVFGQQFIDNTVFNVGVRAEF